MTVRWQAIRQRRCFLSTSNAAVQDWYDRMGMSESKVFYCFDGQTPLSAALLNVRFTCFSRSDAEVPASTR